jgi:hypothetical protein
VSEGLDAKIKAIEVELTWLLVTGCQLPVSGDMV